MAPTLSDYQWLISSAAEHWIREVVESQIPLLRLTRKLRKQLTAERTHLVLEQADLRQRARLKFTHADRMFFTRQGLEQATDEMIADCKAQRLPPGQRLMDGCCGLGGDLLSLAQRQQCVGVERDAVAVLLAQANCDALGHPAKVVQAEITTETPLANLDAWHIDPDRRTPQGRTVDLAQYQPPLEVLQQLVAQNSQAFMKLAPATDVPATWKEQAERQWISHRNECKQQVLWLGKLAQHPAQHTATVIRADQPASFSGNPALPVPVASRIGRYVFDPDPSVRASQLVGALAARYELAAVLSGAVYLTGDRPLTDPLLATFRVDEVLGWNLRRIKQLLRERHVGVLEIKTRGVPGDPAALRRQLSLSGDRSATLLIAGAAHCRTVAILAHRC